MMTQSVATNEGKDYERFKGVGRHFGPQTYGVTVNYKTNPNWNTRRSSPFYKPDLDDYAFIDDENGVEVNALETNYEGETVPVFHPSEERLNFLANGIYDNDAERWIKTGNWVKKEDGELIVE